jgi:hypothetical protein
MVIASPNGGVTDFTRWAKTSVGGPFDFLAHAHAGRTFAPDSSRYLNCPSNLIGQDHPDTPVRGVLGAGQVYEKQRG